MVRNVFMMSLRLCDHKVLHNIASVLIKFFRFRSDFLARISYFLNFWSLRNLIKQLFHSPRWLFTISYPTGDHGIIIIAN